MSLTGNIYYGGQNLENTNPLNEIDYDITSIKADIIQNTNDIELNILAIDEASILILQNETDINNLENKTQKMTCTDVSIPSGLYTVPADTTIFDSGLYCKREIKVESVSDGQISVISSLLQHTNDITGIKAVNTTQTANILTNTNNITTIQGINTTQTANILTNTNNITTIQGINTTQTANILTNTNNITAIQGINTTQTADILTNKNDITSIKTKTDKITISASVFEINNTASQVKFNQDLNMNNFKINNLPEIYISGFSGYMQALVSSTSKFLFKSLLLGDTTNGSGFDFQCIKSGIAKLLSIDYNNVNFNNRTLTNCSTVNTINTNIGTINTTLASNTTRINALEIKSVARCKLTCTTAGLWSMTNIHGFREYIGGGYIYSYGTGHIGVVLDVAYGVSSVDFSVTGSGCQIQPPNRTNLLWVMPGTKSAYYSGGSLIGYTCELYFVRAYGTEWANVVDTGYFDLVIHF
jgi:hypothetical protein